MQPGVRQLEQVARQPDPIEDFEGGGVDGVAAEVAVEVVVVFQQRDIDALAGQEQRQEHAAGPAADDAAAGARGEIGHGSPPSGRTATINRQRPIHNRSSGEKR